MSDIFISYSREDADFVDALILALIEYGWTVWSDKSGMAEGRAFDQQIEDAIVEARVTLVVWSRGSVKSRWVRAEAAFALDKDKLVPVLADHTDPPLQFLHIQCVSLANWDKSPDATGFKSLAAKLSSRLDRVGRVTNPETGGSPQVTKIENSQVVGAWPSVRGLLFPPTPPGFQQYFVANTFFITQFWAAFAFCAATLYGLVDVIAKSDGVGQTQYRFMVTGPLLLLILALSFTQFAKRHSQTFGLICACTALATNIHGIFMAEAKFPVTTGAATSTFMVILGVCAILPLRVGYSALLGSLVILVHEMYFRMVPTVVPPGLHAGYTICMITMALSLVALSYFRDRSLRTGFFEYEQLSKKNVELKNRLMSLAAERNQTRDPRHVSFGEHNEDLSRKRPGPS